MTSQTVGAPTRALGDQRFDIAKVLLITGAHFVHDTYPAFLAPLIPLLTDKLGLSLALAGSLALIMRMSSLVQPFIGHLADRTGLRYFVVAAPALTAILVSSLGLAPTYVLLIPLLVFAGISHAMFHAPAPAMITRVSGEQWGRGMSFFMAGGELGRTFGPLFLVAVVGAVGLENAYVAAIPGVIASLLLYRYLAPSSSDIGARTLSLRAALGTQMQPLILLFGISLFSRSMSIFPFVTFLPTYLTQKGTSFFLAGAAVSVFEFAGVAGALLGGTLSDRIGRRSIFLISQLLVPLSLLAFLYTTGVTAVFALLFAGLVGLATGPVGMAVIQELFTDNRSTANGLYISFGMIASGLSTTLFGAVADAVGLPMAMNAIVLLPLLAVPLTLLLPETRTHSRSAEQPA